MGFNANAIKLQIWAEVFVCEVGYFPSLYLGLPLGNNSRAMSFWGLVCEKVCKRLTKWKKGFFSKVGRLTMIRSVTSRIPCYFSECLVRFVKVWLWEGLTKVMVTIC